MPMKNVRVTTWYLIVLALGFLPYALALAAGVVWLYGHNLLWYFIGFSGVLWLAGWEVLAWLRKRNLAAAERLVQPSEAWTESAQRALQAQQQDHRLRVRSLELELLAAVAQQLDQLVEE